jgi:hypothetical protein
MKQTKQTAKIADTAIALAASAKIDRASTPIIRTTTKLAMNRQKWAMNLRMLVFAAGPTPSTVSLAARHSEYWRSSSMIAEL